MRADSLCIFAQRIAEQTPDFFETKEPGEVIARQRLLRVYFAKVHEGCPERTIAKNPRASPLGFRFDFYFPEEATVVEFAFGLHNPISEFERDVFRCLLAIEDGCAAKRLFLIGKPGAIARLNARGPQAVVSFSKKRFDLTVDVVELQRLPVSDESCAAPAIQRLASTSRT